MIEEFEKYVKELPEELQKKARQCETVEELNKFVAENRIELPNEALEMVSGGCEGSSKKPYCCVDKVECTRVLIGVSGQAGADPYLYQCPVCGKQFPNTLVDWR